MPYKQQRKLNKSFVLTVVFSGLILSVVFWHVANAVKCLAALCFLILFLYIRRSFFYFAHAVNLLKASGFNEEVFRNFDKAVKAGISNEYKNTISFVMIQNGRGDRAKEILNGIIKTKEGTPDGFMASGNLACAYYADGEVQKAIKLLEDIRDKGYTDANISVNLSVCYIVAGETIKAEKMIAEAKKARINSYVLTDNAGCIDIIGGEWKKAEKLYEELIDACPDFPDAYVHKTQVDVHFNRMKKAVENLDFALAKPFYSTGIYSKTYVEELRKLLADSKKQKEVIQAMEEEKNLVATGKAFSGYCRKC